MRKRKQIIPDFNEEEKKLREDAFYLHCSWEGYLSFRKLANEALHRAKLYRDTVGYEESLYILRKASDRIDYALQIYPGGYMIEA